MSFPPNECTVDGCSRAAEAGRQMCHTHRWRARNHKPLAAPVRPYGDPSRTLLEAALAVADAVTDGTEQVYLRAWDRLRKAAQRFPRPGDKRRGQSTRAA